MALSKINTNSIADDAVTTAKVNPAQTDITSVGTLTSFRSTGIDDNADALAMTIDSNENVGIGTASPSDPLHVKGFAQIEGKSGDGNYLRMDNTANTNGKIWRVGSGVYEHPTFSIYDQTNNVFPFNLRNYNNACEIKSATAITLADDGELFIAANCQGLLVLSSYSEGITGFFRCEYLNVAQLVSGTGTFSTGDTDGKICVIVGSNSYSIKIKNRMGGSRDLRAIFVGTHT
tara:strand:+ start:1093 stop:1788 length:696 start_codon:yes stop_codon:yes gene_type:complete